MDWFATTLKTACAQDLKDQNANAVDTLTGELPPYSTTGHSAPLLTYSTFFPSPRSFPITLSGRLPLRPYHQHVLLPQRRAQFKPLRSLHLPAPPGDLLPAVGDPDVLGVHEEPDGPLCECAGDVEHGPGRPAGDVFGCGGAEREDVWDGVCCDCGGGDEWRAEGEGDGRE